MHVARRTLALARTDEAAGGRIFGVVGYAGFGGEGICGGGRVECWVDNFEAYTAFSGGVVVFGSLRRGG
jgi:hypothetical protein